MKEATEAGEKKKNSSYDINKAYKFKPVAKDATSVNGTDLIRFLSVLSKKNVSQNFEREASECRLFSKT